MDDYINEVSLVEQDLLMTVDDFAKQVISLGEEYKISYLIQEGKDLRGFVQAFDIIHIEHILNQFPEKIKKLKGVFGE